jgi:hypothetical protein
MLLCFTCASSVIKSAFISALKVAEKGSSGNPAVMPFLVNLSSFPHSNDINVFYLVYHNWVEQNAGTSLRHVFGGLFNFGF